MCFYLLKRKPRLEPATNCAVFLIAGRQAGKNTANLLEFATSNSLYDDALVRQTRGYPTPR